MNIPVWVQTALHAPPVILLAALLLEAWLPLPARWKPSALIPLLQRLVRRVNPPKTSPKQQWMASLLLPLVVIIPSLIASWSVRNLAPWEIVFDTLLLSWLLESQPVKECLIAVRQLLQQNKLALARLQLSRWVLRDTESLSSMGVSKAAIEMSMLRLLSQWFTVAFCYLLLGIHGALFCRLIQLLAQSCNMKLSANRQCGEFSARMLQTLNTIPVLILVLLQIFLPHGFSSVKNAFRQCRYWPAVTTGMLISGYGTNLGVGLGGPRFYQKQKIRYARIGGIQEPSPAALLMAYHRLIGLGWLCWSLLAGMYGWYVYVHLA
jgi:adenosylcobinamide-phosphate synthase